MSKARSVIVKVVPWVITLAALYFAFKGIDASELWQHMLSTDKLYVVLAIVVTCGSYLMRARRWQFLFPGKYKVLSYLNAYRVLILGFFMNNVLPARAGELVRAHMGSIVTKQTRTTVLATVAAERLADGLMLSSMFAVGALWIARGDIRGNLLWVASLFLLVAIGVGLVLILRSHVFSLLESLMSKTQKKSAHYLLGRVEMFIEGLAPLCSRKTFPVLFLWTLSVWLVELFVFILVCEAYRIELKLSEIVLFMAVVNFSSLIPAAPGGIGTIEAIATSALMSLGVGREEALSMVITQHAIQYAVVGIPGALVMLTWKEFSNRSLKNEAGDLATNTTTEQENIVPESRAKI